MILASLTSDVGRHLAGCHFDLGSFASSATHAWMVDYRKVERDKVELNGQSEHGVVRLFGLMCCEGSLGSLSPSSNLSLPTSLICCRSKLHITIPVYNHHRPRVEILNARFAYF